MEKAWREKEGWRPCARMAEAFAMPKYAGFEEEEEGEEEEGVREPSRALGADTAQL